MPSLTLIVAATLTNGIGQGSRLPWRLPQEMAYFARVTTNAPEGSANAVIMGRNTWESIPPKFRPLKQRMNIVISSNAKNLKESSDSQTDGILKLASVSAHTSLQGAISSVMDPADHAINSSLYRVFIIGGATIYKAALEPIASSDHSASSTTADRILITRVLSPAFKDCDVFFPEFRNQRGKDGTLLWTQTSHEELEAWVGGEVPRGTQQEKGVEYEFQMWTRRE